MNRPPERLNNMKSSINTTTAKSQAAKAIDMRPLSLGPLKRFSRRAVRRVAQSISPANVFRSSTSSSNPRKPASKSTKLFLNLLLVRPWVLVLGFWLFSMVTGSLALDGMLSPRKLKMALPEPAVEESSTTQATAINVAQNAEEAAADAGSAPAESADPDVIVIGSDSAAGGSGLPVFPLIMVVGSCAAGSLLISRRRAMMRLAAARAGRVRTRRPVAGGVRSVKRSGAAQMGSAQSPTKSATTKKAATKAAANKPTRLKPSLKAAVLSSTGLRPKKRRQRVKRDVAPQGSRVLASRTNVQTAVAAATRAQSSKNGSRTARSAARKAVRQAGRGPVRRGASLRTASRHQPVVSVVPANESNALDWGRNSLAHQLDVRPQRRAM